MSNPGVRAGRLYFATGNREKLVEVQAILASYGLTVHMLKARKIEIQSSSLKEIALGAALQIAEANKAPVLVEDTGLFIEALKGFPGPYSSFVYRTMGNEGILRLMEGKRDRAAVFRSAVAFSPRPGEAHVFLGQIRGRVAASEKGKRWGYDPIFEPDGEEGLTYAELRKSRKNQISHRSKAFRRFAKWYLGETSMRAVSSRS